LTSKSAGTRAQSRSRRLHLGCQADPPLEHLAHPRSSRPTRPLICGPPEPKPTAPANSCSRYRSHLI
jgi:hypothetical protein